MSSSVVGSVLLVLSHVGAAELGALVGAMLVRPRRQRGTRPSVRSSVALYGGRGPGQRGSGRHRDR